MSSLDYLDLCRLCLVKDQVSVPIFDGEGDVRQIFLKIAACLPVKLTRDDKLPKKICNDCVYKVELFYEFWNTTSNSEKQLMQWLGEVDVNDKQTYVTAVINQDQSSDNRLDGNVMQQTNEHQNNMGMNIIETMSLEMPMMMSTDQTQMTINTTNNSNSQSIQALPGTSAQQKDGMGESEEDNSDDDMDRDEGLPVKEEIIQDTNRIIEPGAFLNVSLPCDEPGPSGLQQQKNADIPDMVIGGQTTESDNKAGMKKRIQSLSSKELMMIKNVLFNSQTRSKPRGPQIKYEIPTASTTSEPKNLRSSQYKLMETKIQTRRIASTIKKKIKDPLAMHNDSDTAQASVVYSSSDSADNENSWWTKYQPQDSQDDEDWITEREKREKAAHEKHLRFEELKKQRKLRRQNRERCICTVCGKTFSQPDGLRTHMRNHTGDKPFSCQICSKKFIRRTHLKQHALTHTGSTPYVCNVIVDNVVCGRAFAQKPGLIGHRKTHTGTLPPLPRVSIDHILQGLMY